MRLKGLKIWVSDITYVWTEAGWLYLATVLDLFSRKIVGWAMGERITAEAQSGIFEYIEVFYNRIRRHSTLGNISPQAFEQAKAA